MASDLQPNVVSDTLEELAYPEALPREHVMARLADWKQRVHALYDDIAQSLPKDFLIDRSGKHVSREELLQRFQIPSAEVPPVDILRIERPAGTLRARIQPRALWIYGANGKLEVWLFRETGRRAIYELTDMSRLFARPSQWIISPFGDPMDRRPVGPVDLAAMLAR